MNFHWRSPGAKSKKWFATVFLLPVLFLYGCEETKVQRELIRPVKAARVGDVKALTERSFPGRSKATLEVNLSFRVSGPLIARSVNVGDRVKKGQILAKIDPRDYQVRLRKNQGQLARSRAKLSAMLAGARPEEKRKLEASVRKAQAAFRIADLEYERFAKALKTNAVSKNIVDRKLEAKNQAEEVLKSAREALQIGLRGARKEDIVAKRAEIQSLKANVAAAKDDLGYTYLRAPFEGVISATYVENFTDVRPKQEVVRLLDNSKIEFVVDIPESLISNAPYVKGIYIRFAAFPDREFPATIKEVGAEASPTTRTYPVTLIMNQPSDIEVRAGMSGVARARGGDLPDELKKTGIFVPVSAVWSIGKKKFVWVIDEKAQTVAKREVTTSGKLSFQGIQVKGVRAGEWIAIAGVHRLRAGQKVKILKSS